MQVLYAACQEAFGRWLGSAALTDWLGPGGSKVICEEG
jgi:hypothetical protein